MSLFEILSWAVGVGMVAVQVIYLRQVAQKKNTPNATTWLIWMTMSVINTTTYWNMTGGDIGRTLFAVIACAGAVTIFLYCLTTGKFQPLGSTDLLVLALTLIIVYFWQTSKNDRVGNGLLQIVYVISFWPIIRSVREGRPEHPLSWCLAAGSYMLNTINLILHWQPEQSWVTLINPIVNGVLGNGTVAFMIFHVKKKQRIQSN